MPKKALAKDVMTKDPITVTVPGSRGEALRLLVKHTVTGLPVVKEDGSYVGFVARKHIFERPDEDQLALLTRKDYPTLASDAPIEEAAKLLAGTEYHHLTVVEDGKVVGIVTSADLLPVVDEMGLDTAVDQVLHSLCVPVYEGTPLAVANEIMRVSRVFALPVLDDQGLLSGIITDRDLFDMGRVNGTAAVQELGLANEENPWMWEGLRSVMKLYYEERKVKLPAVPVGEVMIRDVKAVSPKTSVSEAARIMHKEDYGQLPVKDSRDRLVGLLTELDVIRVLL